MQERMEEHEPMNERDELAAAEQAAEQAALLTFLASVSRDELPDGPARAALEEAIRAGEVDGLYRPFGYRYHNVTLAGLPPYIDPRVKLAKWRAWWDAGLSPEDEALAEHQRHER